ncbi:hypothetical protein [Amycolatopsis sp. CA-230715]|uniref:hypothetical protein n=1 Tax=Amycolatopsis sp. CA-230715 TaxID=2745196 RepID=UPI001C028BB4|nr:hypothetical protein [Amycolatopsis sp. CA-230715]QWF79171.1 hypothetical protein HUW46_02578 [Amycolatopsis sp. CA-230715]
MGPDTDELEPVNWPSHEGRLPDPRHPATKPDGSAESGESPGTADSPATKESAEPPETAEAVDSAGSAATAADTGKRPRRWWRGLTGSLAAGMVVLAIVVLGAGALAYFGPTEGPGLPSLVAHPAAAAVALGAQRVVDRRSGAVAGAAAVVLLAAVAGILVFFWWF